MKIYFINERPAGHAHPALGSDGRSEAVRACAKGLPTANNWVSEASLWEILIKAQVGKISLPQPTGPFLMSKLKQNGVQILPVTSDHVLRIESLPDFHRDPFDRMLIAQSLEEKLPLVTGDRIFARYPVEVIW